MYKSTNKEVYTYARIIQETKVSRNSKPFKNKSNFHNNMNFESRQPSPLCPILMTPIETAIKIQPDVSIYKPLGFWNPVKANKAASRWWTQNTNQWVSSAFGRASPDRLASSVVRHLFSSLWTGRFNKLKFLYSMMVNFFSKQKMLWKSS